MARRHRAGPDLIVLLGRELRALARVFRRGFAVRLHVLGDFWSLDYVGAWLAWMVEIPGLHVWGYTAHPRDSEIGAAIDAANDVWPGRWAIRFSTSPDSPARPRQATTIWRPTAEPVVAEGLVCPAQQHRTASCSTCGLCWSPAAQRQRIVFIGHGNVSGNKSVSA